MRIVFIDIELLAMIILCAVYYRVCIMCIYVGVGAMRRRYFHRFGVDFARNQPNKGRSTKYVNHHGSQFGGAWDASRHLFWKYGP